MEIRCLRWTLGVATLFWLAACGAPTAPAPSPTLPITQPPPDAKGELADKLKEAGVQVKAMGPVERAALGVAGERWSIDGEEIELYLYDSPQALQEVVARLAPDGMSVAGEALQWDAPPRLWTAGPLLVAYAGRDGGTILLLSGLLGDPLVEPPAAGEEPYPPAVVAAIQAAADWFGVPPEEVLVVDFRAVQWPDSCLGVKSTKEYCLQVITPGWRVTLSAAGRQVRVHTDETGARLRVVP